MSGDALLSLDQHGEIICCPSCGNPDGTHVDAVEVHTQTGAVAVMAYGEDEHSGYELCSVPPGPGPRRHTVLIRFDCESCPGQTLILQQHKGHTRTFWLDHTEIDDQWQPNPPTS